MTFIYHLIRNGPTVFAGALFGLATSLFVLTLTDIKPKATCSYSFPVSVGPLLSLVAFCLWLVVTPEDVAEDRGKSKVLMFAVWVLMWLATGVSFLVLLIYYTGGGRHCSSAAPGVGALFFTLLLPLTGAIVWWIRRENEDDDDDW